MHINGVNTGSFVSHIPNLKALGAGHSVWHCKRLTARQICYVRFAFAHNPFDQAV